MWGTDKKEESASHSLQFDVLLTSNNAMKKEQAGRPQSFLPKELSFSFPPFSFLPILFRFLSVLFNTVSVI